METRDAGVPGAPETGLGNFLSGMETAFRLLQQSPHLALETSLVEWKHKVDAMTGKVPEPWKLP